MERKEDNLILVISSDSSNPSSPSFPSSSGTEPLALEPNDNALFGGNYSRSNTADIHSSPIGARSGHFNNNDGRVILPDVHDGDILGNNNSQDEDGNAVGNGIYGSCDRTLNLDLSFSSLSSLDLGTASSSQTVSHRPVHSLSDSSDETSHSANVNTKNRGNTTPKKRKNEPASKNLASKKAMVEKQRNAAKANQERKKAEQLQKLADKANLKAKKHASAQAQKVYRPEECIKYLTAILDPKFFEEDFGGNFKASLKEVEVLYDQQTQIIPLTITWVRKFTINHNTRINEEDLALFVIPMEQAITLVKARGLYCEVQMVKDVINKPKLALVIHGTEKYFRTKKGKASERVTREEFLEALVEVQLFTGCDHRLVESSLELATLIAQFTKAVAEIPYRLEKAKKDDLKLDWFGESDNKDCVRVDKNGLGLARLWQQQICEFNLAGLEIAEAITAVFPSPQSLFQAYDLCSSQGEGEKLLQDIQIRRGVGTLSSVRRVGPELSKKIYAFFTAMDGDAVLA